MPLIDLVIHADRNVLQKEAEKKLKNKRFCIESQKCGTSNLRLYQ